MKDLYLRECARLYTKYHMGNDIDGYLRGLKKEEYVDIPFVEMTVTTRCNLKCKYCSNLIPYLPKQKHFNLIQNIEDLNKLLHAVHLVYRLKIHGGEPLLYPQLNQFLGYALAQPQIIDVRISTNGTVIPNADLLQIMKNPKFVLHISQYPIAEKSVKELIKILQENNIRYFYMEGQEWSDLGDYEVWRERSMEETEAMIQACNMRKCTSYYEGKIYVCSRAANRCAITGQEEGICLGIEDDLQKLWAFFKKPYFKTCQYCDGVLADTGMISAGEQGEN